MASAYQPVGLDFYWNVWDWLGDNLNAPIGVEKNTLERLACTLARIHQASDRGIVFEFDAKHEHKATRIEANKVMQEFDESVAACSRPFISRVGMYNIKFAIASAAWNLRSKVLREDWEIARALTISMWGSILKFISHYDVSVMNRDQQKMHDWICESIRDGQEFVKQRDVLLRFRAIPADKRKKHLQDLVEMGALVENRHISDKGGRPSIRYTLPKRGL